MARVSAVQNVVVREVGFASILLAGDCVNVQPRSKALAVQRQSSIYYGNEGSFQQFPIFSKPIPLPVIDENVHFTVNNLNPLIHVKNVDIVSISSSSVLQIGSNRTIDAENRTKHIRQLISPIKPGQSH